MIFPPQHWAQVLDIGPDPQPKSDVAFPVAALREMAIISCSTKLAHLHYQLKSAGLGARMDFVQQLRDQGLAADFLAVMTY